MLTSLSAHRRLLLFILLLLAVKIVLIPFSHTVNSDAVWRVFNSWRWAEDPFWMKHGVWLPFHYYLNGLGLMIWDETVAMPKVINALCTSVMLWPFFHFVRREFDTKTAGWAVVFLGLSPLIFRFSFMALAGPPFWFCLLFGMDRLSKGFKTRARSAFLWAGLWMTLAAGFRYEAWLLMTLFACGVLWLSGWKRALIFSLCAGVFPLVWMITSAMETGDAFWGFPGNVEWTMSGAPESHDPTFEERLRGLWYYPFSLFVAIGPIALFLAGRNWIASLKQIRQRTSQSFWAICLLLLLVIFLVATSAGVLVLQHRFSGPLILLLIAFLAAKPLTPSMRRIWLPIGLIFMLAGPLVYNADNLEHVPQLKGQNLTMMGSLLNRSLQEEDALVLDFLGWEETYFLALRSYVHPDHIFFAPPNDNAAMVDAWEEDLINFVESHDKGEVVYKTGSPLGSWISAGGSPWVALHRSHEVILFDHEEGEGWKSLFWTPRFDNPED